MVVFSFSSTAQDIILSSSASLAEKVYLQLDNKVYTTDQLIWFKAIVASARDHRPSDLSGVLHVELIDPTERIVEKKRIKLINGIGEGFFQLSMVYMEGHYQVRAYTTWNRNFGSQFIFQEYVQVFAASGTASPDPFINISLIEGPQKRLRAIIDPLLIDSFHSKELVVNLQADGQRDSVSVKKVRSSQYLLDYPIPSGSRFISLQLETKNQVRYSKTIVLEKDYLDLQFFPESGELVQGLPGHIGFKAIDSSGKGTMLEGDIINKHGELVTIFRSNALGMGSIWLSRVDSTAGYQVRINSKNGGKKTWKLPRIAAVGHILAIRKMGNDIQAGIHSNYFMDDSVIVRVSCRGAVYYDIKGRLRNGQLTFPLSSNSLPDGIIDFTLMDITFRPLAERLYFNIRQAERMELEITSDKELYLPREKTTIRIAAKGDSAHMDIATASLLVFNQSQQAQGTDTRQNILSYFLVNSDLKGVIENPGFYFTKNATANDIDALLLTQGWRKYKYGPEKIEFTFQPEMNLALTGTVMGGLFNQKEKKGVGLTLMTFGKNPTVQQQFADSLGRFSFPIEEAGEEVNAIIQTANKSGAKRNYSIVLDKTESPAVDFHPLSSVAAPDSIISEYVKQNIERKKKMDAYLSATEGITLGEVIVKGYFMTPERKLVADKYGKPTTVIEGEAIRAKEEKWSYGLYSVLLFNFPDKVKVTRYPSGILYASIYNSELTLVVIDGIAVRAVDYGLIPSIAPSEVKSFELIPYAKNFRSLFCEALPEACGMNAPMVGNVIAIYTYGAKGIFGASPAVGIVKTAVPVFSAPREFYSPKYEQLTDDDWLRPDMRTLLHWQPSVPMDSAGQGKVEFYNGDNTGRIQVIAEVISRNGEIGYKELFYEVKKKQ